MIVQNTKGFFIGRFDLKFPNMESVKAGKNFKILELNGVTGEPLHIYQPNFSLFKAWKTIFTLYNLMFQIGKLNYRRGYRPYTFGKFIKLIYKAWSKNDK